MCSPIRRDILSKRKPFFRDVHDFESSLSACRSSPLSQPLVLCCSSRPTLAIPVDCTPNLIRVHTLGLVEGGLSFLWRTSVVSSRWSGMCCPVDVGISIPAPSNSPLAYGHYPLLNPSWKVLVLTDTAGLRRFTFRLRPEPFAR